MRSVENVENGSMENGEGGKRGVWKTQKKTLVIGSDILYMYFDLFES